MRKPLLITLVLLSVLALFGGCERSDYQHPLYRSTNK
jgi:hypothetical protein